MSMGYPAAQGYVGDPTSPVKPKSKYGKLFMGLGLGLEGLGAYQQAGADRSLAVAGRRSVEFAAQETRRRSNYNQWLLTLQIDRYLGGLPGLDHAGDRQESCLRPELEQADRNTGGIWGNSC